MTKVIVVARAESGSHVFNLLVAQRGVKFVYIPLIVGVAESLVLDRLDFIPFSTGALRASFVFLI